MSPIQLGLLAALILSYWLGRSRLQALIERIGRERGIAKVRVRYVGRVSQLGLSLLLVILVCVVADVGVDDFGLFFSSVFAVLGVALFAQWSILSNLTSSILIFFFFPYRVGDQVKILDGDNSLEGTLDEITLFHVILSDAQGKRLTFPNAMVFQKAVVIGKAEEPLPKENSDG